jgi:hypothetical protein
MQSIKEIKHLRKTKSRHWDESYEMTLVLKHSFNDECIHSYVRKYKEGWCFYGQSQWYLFRDNDQKTINDFVSSQK